MIFTGTAAWTIPKAFAEHFPKAGSHLERYSQVLNCVEINSSFYKDHLAKSYERWAASTPADFKFSVKLNKRFTHECDLAVDADDLSACLQDIAQLHEKWRVLLIQFPKSVNFQAHQMDKFYQVIRRNFKGAIALEARNMTWMSEESKKLMKDYNVSKVIADPEICPDFIESEISYYRLHGSPEIYKSDYPETYLEELYKEFMLLQKEQSKEIWCIFDNTTFGYATNNAVTIAKKGDQYERYQGNNDNGASYLHPSH